MHLTGESDLTGAIKNLDREWQLSRLRSTESEILESRATCSSFDAELAKTLADRAEKAEALVTTLKEELTESENAQSKLNLRLERMQDQIDMLNGVKRGSYLEVLPSPPLSTLSHSSTPVGPPGSSKRKAGPTPSTEQVIRKKAKISKKRPGARRIRISDISRSERLVVKDVRVLLGILVVTEDAYPDISGRQEKFLRDSWAKISKESQLQVNFTQAAASLINRDLSGMRTHAKYAARSLVQTSFGISWNSSKAQNKKQVERLLDRYGYIYKDPVKRTGIYRHPSIQTMINTAWFRDSTDKGPTHADFSDGGHGIPLPTIAFALTAIHCALDEWVNGQHENVEFRSQLYREHYLRHLAGLKALEKHTTKEQIVPRLRKHWLKMALRNFARPTGLISTHLTAPDFEAVKAEWKDLDLDEDD
ncbi:hypothetical protein MD484_g8219, partial [Candolleomyces efflorescens]